MREVTVTELNENDEQSAFNTKIEQARGKNFAYVRRMLWKDGYLNTLCLPFDVNNIEASPLAGAQVYTFSGATVQNNIMQLDLTQVTDGKLLQGVPYFLRWTGTDGKIELLHFYDVTTWDDDKEAGTDSGTDVKCHGFYYKSHIGDIKEDTETEGIHTHYNFFLWSNDEIHWPSDGDDPAAKMKGFRAHFYIDGKGGQSQGNVDYMPGMPAKLRIHNAFGGTTGIEETENGQRKAEKILRNGQLYILYNGQMYNVQGQLVADN